MTSHLPSAARNMGLTEAIEHDKRYEIADEYLDVVYALWESSWHDDAVKRDKNTNTWTDPALVRPINHKGKYFKDIPGPVGQCISHSMFRAQIQFIYSVYLAPVAPEDASTVPGRKQWRGHDVRRQGSSPRHSTHRTVLTSQYKSMQRLSSSLVSAARGLLIKRC